MAIGDNYATDAELKSRLGISDANDDVAIAAAMSTSSRNVEKYCRRQFNDSEAVSARRYYPLSREIVLVDDFHTTTGLVVETDVDDDGTYETLWASSDYECFPLGGVRDGVTGWPYWKLRAVDAYCFYDTRRPNVRVTARWGWEAVPASVKEATLALAEEVFKMKDSPYGIAGFGEFGFVRVRENPKIVSMLKDYRRKAIRVAS